MVTVCGWLTHAINVKRGGFLLVVGLAFVKSRDLLVASYSDASTGDDPFEVSVLGTRLVQQVHPQNWKTVLDFGNSFRTRNNNMPKRFCWKNVFWRSNSAFDIHCLFTIRNSSLKSLHWRAFRMPLNWFWLLNQDQCPCSILCSELRSLFRTISNYFELFRMIRTLRDRKFLSNV